MKRNFTEEFIQMASKHMQLGKCKLKHNDLPLHTYQNDYNKKTVITPSADNAEKLDHIYCQWEFKMVKPL